jgi:hypothetical protein
MIHILIEEYMKEDNIRFNATTGQRRGEIW